MFYKLLNAYTHRFSFPHRGLKYFLKMAKLLGIADKVYTKKLHHSFYMDLNPTEHIQQQLFWYGYYEKELGDLLQKIIKPGDVFFDIGANIGYFSLLAASKGATVHSYEPVTNIFNKLVSNIKLNKLIKVLPINMAVGEVGKEKELHLSGKDNEGMSSFYRPENYSGKTENVKVISLDESFSGKELTKIDIIKLDIEGYELNALKGMKKIIGSYRPLLIIEINPETLAMAGVSFNEIYSLMKGFGYDGYEVKKSGDLHNVNEVVTDQAMNVLFIYGEKKLLFPELF